MAIRNIIRIDEELCDGCGLCVPACAEGALQIIDGKARLVRDSDCDGLGACLGQCPRNALHIEQREADEFVDPHAGPAPAATTPPTCPSLSFPAGGGCPGAAARRLTPAAPAPAGPADPPASQLGNWPVQLALLPPTAPVLEDAELLLAADCAPLAVADFHRRFLSGRVVAISCPKLDDPAPYLAKLAAIFSRRVIRSVHVVHMEVPCCTGLLRLVRQALAQAGRPIPLFITEVGVRGDVRPTVRQEPVTA